MIDQKPLLPWQIDWTAPGIWAAFRKAYDKSQTRGALSVQSFTFRGFRFVPSFAKRLLDTYGTEQPSA